MLQHLMINLCLALMTNMFFIIEIPKVCFYLKKVGNKIGEIVLPLSFKKLHFLNIHMTPLNKICQKILFFIVTRS